MISWNCRRSIYVDLIKCNIATGRNYISQYHNSYHDHSFGSIDPFSWLLRHILTTKVFLPLKPITCIWTHHMYACWRPGPQNTSIAGGANRLKDVMFKKKIKDDQLHEIKILIFFDQHSTKRDITYLYDVQVQFARSRETELMWKMSKIKCTQDKGVTEVINRQLLWYRLLMINETCLVPRLEWYVIPY